MNHTSENSSSKTMDENTSKYILQYFKKESGEPINEQPDTFEHEVLIESHNYICNHPYVQKLVNKLQETTNELNELKQKHTIMNHSELLLQHQTTLNHLTNKYDKMEQHMMLLMKNNTTKSNENNIQLNIQEKCNITCDDISVISESNSEHDNNSDSDISPTFPNTKTVTINIDSLSNTKQYITENTTDDVIVDKIEDEDEDESAEEEEEEQEQEQEEEQEEE